MRFRRTMACCRPAALALLALAVLATAAPTSQAQAPPSTDPPDPAPAATDRAAPPASPSTDDPAPPNQADDWRQRYGSPSENPGQGPGGGLVSSLLALAVVIACIVLGAWLLRRFLPGLRSGGGSMALRVMARTALSPRQAVYLVRCGRRLLVLGTGAEQVRTLAEITDPEEVAELAGRCEQQRPTSVTNTFREIFSQQSREMQEPEPPSDGNGGSAQLESEVRDIKGELEQLVERVHDWKRMSK